MLPSTSSMVWEAMHSCLGRAQWWQKDSSSSLAEGGDSHWRCGHGPQYCLVAVPCTWNELCTVSTCITGYSIAWADVGNRLPSTAFTMQRKTLPKSPVGTKLSTSTGASHPNKLLLFCNCFSYWLLVPLRWSQCPAQYPWAHSMFINQLWWYPFVYCQAAGLCLGNLWFQQESRETNYCRNRKMQNKAPIVYCMSQYSQQMLYLRQQA